MTCIPRKVSLILVKLVKVLVQVQPVLISTNVYKRHLIVIQMPQQIKVLLVSILLAHSLVNVKMVSCQMMSRLLMLGHLLSHTAMTFQNAKTISILVSKMRMMT